MNIRWMKLQLIIILWMVSHYLVFERQQADGARAGAGSPRC